MSQLLDVFVSICEIDNSKYFLCNYKNIIHLASLIDHIPLKMSERYMFACTPVSRSNTFLVSSFVKFVRLYSSNEPIGVEEVTNIIDWHVEKANTPEKLKRLETIFDTLDLYLWLGYRFPTMFPSMEDVKLMRKKLNDIIDQSLKDITKEKKGKKTINFEDILGQIELPKLQKNENRRINKQSKRVEETKNTSGAADNENTSTPSFNVQKSNYLQIENILSKKEESENIKLRKDVFLFSEIEDVQIENYVSSLIKEIPLKENDRLNLIEAPVSPKQTILSSVYFKIIKKFSNGELITVDNFVEINEWPKNEPQTIRDLIIFEELFDSYNLYYWLKNLYPTVFPDDTSTVKVKMDEIRNKIISSINSIHVTEKDVDIFFRIQSRFESEAIETFDEKASNKKSVSSNLLNALSNKAAEIQREKHLQDEISDDEEITKKSDKNDIDLGVILNNRDRNDPSYARDLEVLVKEMIRKNVLKEKSIKKILNERKNISNEDT
jgi:hypothetical protein